MKTCRRPPQAFTIFFVLGLVLSFLPVNARGATVVPPPVLFPLNQVAVPEPPNLFQFVKNKRAAIKLGKALFWDMQAGSDGTQACASCHYFAGVDTRRKNSLHPGYNQSFQVRGPNEALVPADFPFLKRADPDIQSPIVSDADDVVGSQGVRFTQFVDITVGSAVESGSPIPDPLFQVNGANLRRVTGRQAPSVINAVFNLNNLWDGRAHFLFNGVNPFGPLDPSARIWVNLNGTLTQQAIGIQFASLASQATGPPVDDDEMSYHGRTFPQLGRKLLNLTPLGKQLVHPDDGELGPLSRALLRPDGSMAGAKGLKGSYAQMIRDAFQDRFWNGNQLTPEGYSQMEANFSLFWGLAIQLYEATLVSDESPFDLFLGGDQNALSDQQKEGFNLFFGAAGCAGCHADSELTSASVRASAFLTNASNGLVDPMTVASGGMVIYDAGFINTAVRPYWEDLARGADSPFINPLTGFPFPLSFSALAELQALGKLGFNLELFPLGAPVTPTLPATIPADFPVANKGNFKIPSLRNVELTAPYFHNGGSLTLMEVVQFYTRGGDFRVENEGNLDVLIADIGPLQHNLARKEALIAFLHSFTDDRVRYEAAPFDHPELLVPEGDPEVLTRLPARDMNGNEAAPLPTVTLEPVSSPTTQQSQLIGGSREDGTLVQVRVNDGAPWDADYPGETAWSCNLPGLLPGNNTVTVTATDIAGGVTTLTATIVREVSNHALRAAAGANGSITPAGLTSVTSGATLSYSITPNPGYRVSALVVDGSVLPGATSYSFDNVQASHYINAYFAPEVSYSIRAAAGANGSITPAGASSVAGGANQSYSITPNPGFRVAALVVDGSVLPGATSYSFDNVQANHYLNAYFAPEVSYSIRAAAGANGSITPAGVSSVAGGASQSYSITPAPGYQVSALVVDGAVLPAATSYSFSNVGGNHYINAYFGPL